MFTPRTPCRVKKTLRALLAISVSLAVLLPAIPAARAASKTVVAYGGTVTDQENNGLGGVVVYVATGTYGGYTTTNDNGQWGIGFNGAGMKVTEDYYWNVSSGPLLASVTLPYTDFSYNEKVNVWMIQTHYNLSYEYSHTTNANIKFSVDSTMTIGVQAKYDAGANIGFLQAKVGGSIGTNLSVTSSYSHTTPGDNSSMNYKVWGYGIQVEDTSGKVIRYVQPYQNTSTLQFKNAIVTDPMTMTQAINQIDQHKQYYMFENVSPGPTTWGVGCITGTQVSLSYDVSAGFPAAGDMPGGSVSFTTIISFSTTGTQAVEVNVNNPTSTWQWYVIYQGGPYGTGADDFHVWLYSTGGQGPPE